MRRTVSLGLRLGLVAGLLFGAFAPRAGHADAQSAALINAGQYEAARARLAGAPENSAARLLLEGRIAKAQGDAAGSIPLLRAALRAAPGDLPVRRELAHALYLNGQMRPARYHLDILMQADPDPALRAGYARLLAQINTETPLEMGVYFAFEPSTNINRGSIRSTFSTEFGDPDISAASRAQSGIGATFGITGRYRWPGTGAGRSALLWQLSHTGYTRASTQSATRAYIAFEHERGRAPFVWSVTPFVRREWRKDRASFTSPGVALRGAAALSDTWVLRASVAAEERDYDTLSQQNGPYILAALSLTYQASAALSFSGGVQTERSRANLPHLSYDGTSVFVRGTRAWRGGLITGLSAYAGTRDFRGVFPLTTRSRADEFGGLSGDIHFTNLELRGFTPQLSCRLEKYRSNVALFDYDAAGCTVTFTRSF